MIRHQLTAQKQVFIGSLFIGSVVLMGTLKYVFEVSGLLVLTDSARIEVYLIGILAALIYMHKDWSNLLQDNLLRAPFESALLAGRFALYQIITFTLIYFLLRDIATSRAFLFGFLAIGFPLNTILITWLPSLLRRFFNRSGSFSGILVGKGRIPQAVIDYTERCHQFSVNFREFYGDEQEQNVAYIRKGSVTDLKDMAPSSDASISRVLFFGKDLEDPEYCAALDFCYRRGLRVQVMLHEEKLFDGLARHVVDGDTHFLTFADEPLQNPLNQIVKRCIDIVFSLFAVVFFLAPLTLVAWLAQRRQSPGPIFFRQTRHGLGRQTFTILKFRTMSLSKTDESVQATATDTRFYPFGKLMRRLSLDEFPQFINVLQGNMSIIGPRPHLAVHDDLFEQEISTYRIRHYVKPGITGYAQIRGFRGEVTSAEDIHSRVRHDIYYISNWSLKLDFYIATKTLVTILQPPATAF